MQAALLLLLLLPARRMSHLFFSFSVQSRLPATRVMFFFSFLRQVLFLYPPFSLIENIFCLNSSFVCYQQQRKKVAAGGCKKFRDCCSDEDFLLKHQRAKYKKKRNGEKSLEQANRHSSTFLYIPKIQREKPQKKLVIVPERHLTRTYQWCQH